jgi:hypothetical protein
MHGVDHIDEELSSAMRLGLGMYTTLEYLDLPGTAGGAGDIRSIFELNQAGRRYLVQDGSSISKGVDVLSRVNNNINSVFLHLLENPRLCDRSAVALSSIGNIDNSGSTSPGNYSGGKREQEAPSRMGNDSRRRLE